MAFTLGYRRSSIRLENGVPDIFIDIGEQGSNSGLSLAFNLRFRLSCIHVEDGVPDIFIDIGE